MSGTVSALLGLRSGERVAVIGAGGKSALIDRLAGENAERGVLIAPTTRIALAQVRERPGVRHLGVPQGEKLLAAPLAEIEAAAHGAALTLMEADGSKGLPLKGWDTHEPVVPSFATLTVGVVSARALGLAAEEANVHRLPLFLAQSGLSCCDPVDAAALARMISRCMEACAAGRKAILINQAEDAVGIEAANAIARILRASFSGAVLIGSMKEGTAWSGR